MDVAIVGAGPAGALAAWTLARAGARVTMFDASHPREKACGGGVTGRALQLVAGAVDRRAFAATPIQSARFTQAGTSHADVAIDGEALIVTSRADFDAALATAAQRAGATLEAVRVVDLNVDPGGVRLETDGGSRRADFVFGADGANSLVRRRVARPFRRDQLSIATGFYAHGVTSREIVIEFVADPPGYLWSFPRPDHLAIGVCAEAAAGVSPERLRARTQEWMRATQMAHGARLQPYSWPIPSLSARDARSLTLSGDRWCLLGDAAGLVDPITREGIYFALASGRWAAESLADGSGPSAYAARVQEDIGRELAAAARLKAGFFRPAFVNLFLRALQQSAGIRAVMADLIAGRQTYAGLKWRLMKTLELGYAWRVLAGAGSSSGSS